LQCPCAPLGRIIVDFLFHLMHGNCTFLLQYILLIFFLGMMAMGAVDVVRGSRSSVEELLQIYNHSERFAKELSFKCILFLYFIFTYG